MDESEFTALDPRFRGGERREFGRMRQAPVLPQKFFSSHETTWNFPKRAGIRVTQRRYDCAAQPFLNALACFALLLRCLRVQN